VNVCVLYMSVCACVSVCISLCVCVAGGMCVCVGEMPEGHADYSHICV